MSNKWKKESKHLSPMFYQFVSHYIPKEAFRTLLHSTPWEFTHTEKIQFTTSFWNKFSEGVFRVITNFAKYCMNVNIYFYPCNQLYTTWNTFCWKEFWEDFTEVHKWNCLFKSWNGFKVMSYEDFFYFFIFSVWLLSVLRGHSGFFHPRHKGQWPPTPTIKFLRKSQYFPF